MSNKWKIKSVLVILFALTCLANVSALDNQQMNLSAAPPFSENELSFIKQYLFDNITTEDHVVVKEQDGRVIRSIPGAVIASPSNNNPAFNQDYQFHWVRDSAITMNEVAFLHAQASPAEKKRLKPYLINYINFERKAQKQMSRDGEETLGQPKYSIDGTIWEGAWGRPQNDGPALRAITMSAIANSFLHDGDEKYVREVMSEVITTDLDYVASHWGNTNFDLWEELNDQDHFFTKMVQRKSLQDGAALLKKLKHVFRLGYTGNVLTLFGKNSVYTSYTLMNNPIESGIRNR